MAGNTTALTGSAWRQELEAKGHTQCKKCRKKREKREKSRLSNLPTAKRADGQVDGRDASVPTERLLVGNLQIEARLVTVLTKHGTVAHRVIPEWQCPHCGTVITSVLVENAELWKASGCTQGKGCRDRVNAKKDASR
jgi:hypothetical protein